MCLCSSLHIPTRIVIRARRPCAKECLKRGVCDLRQHDLELDQFITMTVLTRNAPALHAEHDACVGALGYRQHHDACRCWRPYARPKHCFGQSYREFEMDVVALAHEVRMGLDGA